MKKQGYILRYYLPVKPHFDEEYTEKRFEELLSFCKETNTGAVMLYVALNPDWYYMSDSVEYAEACRDQMIPYIKRLRDAGISYQLNFQNLIGSVFGGVDFSSYYGWENLVDHTGKESLGCGCPLGKKFREHAGQRLRIWAETEPDVIWIDDDLRIHNHGTPVFAELDGKGHYTDYYCFCDEHLRRFNELRGTHFDRETLVKEITKPGAVSETRIAYLTFLGETMAETADWIRRTVQDISPNTRLAQMTSVPDTHAAEGRDWNSFLSSLCGKYPPMIRAHFGPYMEGNPRDFVNCYRMLAQTMTQLRETYAGPVEYCPEVENTRFTTWAKSSAATAYQLTMSAFLGCSDITLSLYDLDGGSFADEPLYGKMLKEEKPFLDKLVSLDLGSCRGDGVIIPTSGKSGKTYRMRECDGYSALGGDTRYIEKYLLKAGIPCHYLTPSDMNGDGVVALDPYSAGFLSDEELRKILCGNVLLDGGAAEVLCNRGFADQIGLCGMEKQRIVVNAEVINTFTRADGTYIRVPSRIPVNSWYKTTPADGAEILSVFLTPDGNKHPGMTYFENSLGGRIALYPACKAWGDGFFTHYRVKFFKDVLSRLCPTIPRIDCHGYTLAAVKEKGSDERYYFVGNLSTDILTSITINGKTITDRLEVYGTAVYREKDGAITKIERDCL